MSRVPALALLALVAQTCCAAMPRRADQPMAPLASVERPALAFTVWPASDSEGTPDRGYRVAAVFVAAVETARGRFAFYRVSVLGLRDDVLVGVPTDLPVDAQARALRDQADAAARTLMQRARLSCDSVRSRMPAETFGHRCA